MSVDLSCSDFLKDNPHVYAHKARQKKIALVRMDLANHSEAPVEFELNAAHLVANGSSHAAESPETLFKKFREFTWGFIFFAILDCHPVLIFFDLLFLVMGPLYNRRLHRQLQQLTNDSVMVKAGEKKAVVLGFLKVKHPPESVELRQRTGGGDWIPVTHTIGA